MLEVRRLVLLRDLAEHGTVTAVAELHRVTPSAVSQQLRALEAEAGAELLHREGRTVRLTAAGAALAAECEQVLAALERAHSTVRALDDQVSGEVLIGCFPSALESMAAPLAAALRRRHSALRPRIIEAEPDEAVAMLKRRELDLTLHYRYHLLGTALPAGLTARALFDDQLALAVPERLRVPAERGGVAALRHQPWIATPETSACREVMLHVCHAAGFSPLIEHGYRDLRSALCLVAEELGLTILPMMMCRNPPDGTAILPLPGRGRVVEAVLRAGTDTHPAVAATLAALGAVGNPVSGDVSRSAAR